MVMKTATLMAAIVTMVRRLLRQMLRQAIFHVLTEKLLSVAYRNPIGARYPNSGSFIIGWS